MFGCGLCLIQVWEVAVDVCVGVTVGVGAVLLQGQPGLHSNTILKKKKIWRISVCPHSFLSPFLHGTGIRTRTFPNIEECKENLNLQESFISKSKLNSLFQLANCFGTQTISIQPIHSEHLSIITVIGGCQRDAGLESIRLAYIQFSALYSNAVDRTATYYLTVPSPWILSIHWAILNDSDKRKLRHKNHSFVRTIWQSNSLVKVNRRITTEFKVFLFLI